MVCGMCVCGVRYEVSGTWVDGQVCLCLCICVHMRRCDWMQLGVFECMCLFACALAVDPSASASLVISLQNLPYAQHFVAQPR